LAALISYSWFTAALIWRLLAVESTRNTSVLSSSIFFIADSVVSGDLMTLRDVVGGTTGVGEGKDDENGREAML
jgi:hypothetical protein